MDDAGKHDSLDLQRLYVNQQGKAGPVATRASGIWPGAPEDLVITFACDDLEEFR